VVWRTFCGVIGSLELLVLISVYITELLNSHVGNLSPAEIKLSLLGTSIENFLLL
jgi:hypothetical protein